MTLFRDRPELLAAFRRGERPALEAVYWAYVELVERMARVAAHGHADDVADLVQEIFARAFADRARIGFDGVREFAPYLATIARNTIIDWARRRGRELPLGDQFDPPGDDPVEEPPWAAVEVMRAVEHYLAALPPELRAVHHERYVLGHSQRDAAATLGLSRQQLRTREEQLRNGLRRELENLQPKTGPRRKE